MNNTSYNMKATTRRGGMLVLMAFVLVVFLISAALCVDVANMHMVRAELRTATDAAARAGAEALARSQDLEEARNAAIAIAAQNRIAGKGLTLQASDVLLGNTSPDGTGTFVFTEGATPINSVQVRSERSEDVVDGPVPLFLAGVFGRESFAPRESATATSTVRDIALVLDISGSMDGSKLGALITAVNLFLNDVDATSPGAKISLTSYSTNASRDIALTTNFNSIQNEVDDFDAAGRTNIREAIEFGSASLEGDPGRREHADRIIVLMTDGNFNEGGSPIPAANTSANLGHQIHTITFGDGADQATMQQIADRADGIHIHADGNNDLVDAFREIARTLAVILVD